MDKQYENLIRLVHSVLTNGSCDLSKPDFVRILQLAQAQGVANLLYPAYCALPEAQRPDGAHLRLCRELAYGAVTRDVLRSQEVEELLSTLHAAGIRVLPLKGTVLKRLYPKSEYRDMCDTDLLIRPEDGKRIRELLQTQGWTPLRFEAGSTDFYVSPLGMNYELHRSLHNEGYTDGSREFLDRLYSMALPGENCLTLPPEVHYVYVLTHMVKHLFRGGSGLRTVMDVWVCRKSWNFDEARLEAFLRQTDLLEFSRKAEKLARVWFEGEETDALCLELGEYLLSGSLFGTEKRRTENRLMDQQRRAGRLGYSLRRLFPSRTVMGNEFPVVKKWPVLLPVFWPVRFCRSVLFRRTRLQQELSALKTADKALLQERYALFERSGLHMNKRKDGIT